jgi:hypothetical protein
VRHVDAAPRILPRSLLIVPVREPDRQDAHETAVPAAVSAVQLSPDAAKCPLVPVCERF